MRSPGHRDPADWPENSHHPDMAEHLDSLEDRCCEHAAVFWKRVGMPADRRQLIAMTGRFAAETFRSLGAPGNSLEGQEAISRMLATIIDSGPDALVTAECLDFAIGTNVQGVAITEQKIADKHGVTRAAISKRCIHLTEEFNIPPSAGMRTIQARRRYGMRQRGRRTVIKKPKWPLAGLLAKHIAK